jgi:formamidopyrimidine-DNA glycosylase
MPELPEVETVARGLDKRVKGDVIESVWLGSKPEPLKSPAAEIAQTLEGKKITGVRRVGKHIVIDLQNAAKRSSGGGRLARQSKKLKKNQATPEGDGQAQWIVHLGMTGRMLVCEADEEVAKHTHAIAKLKSGRELRFVDPRRFGRLSVTKGFAAAGSEPLEVELDKFVQLFHGRKTPIKSALLNQKLLSGVGNIYADESLFRSGIRPKRRASSLSKEDLRRLYLALQQVLQEAIKLGGSSVSDYVDSDGEEGFFQLQHRVYGREGEPCLVCKSSIKRVVIGGRSSHSCPKCQK